MISKKYRISIAEGTGKGSTSYSPIDIDSFDEFIKYLEEHNVKEFNLKYHSIIDDVPDFYEKNLSVIDIKQEHFDWLSEKSKFQSKSFEIISRFKVQNSNQTRKANFKLGEFHGKLNPTKSDCEAKLRNDIFLIGQIGLVFSLKTTTRVRIIAKEMPLQEKINRGNCIDLFGIDKDWTPYIIELKLAENTEKLSDAVKQVNKYCDLFGHAKDSIETEIKGKLFYKDFKFNGVPKKIILSEKEYFGDLKSYTKHSNTQDNLLLCSFYKTAEIKDSNGITLLAKKSSSGVVLLSVLNK